MIHTEPAWAKLNLTLDILGKRPDGYHDLRMVMQSIDLKDTVTLQEEDAPGIRVASSCRFLPCDETNIAAKAILRFFENTGLPRPGFSVGLEKEIPVCAGMAGGSSDGAAVLRILRREYYPELPQEKLEQIAALVGSDVPYCVRGGTALAEGRGERLTDLPSLPLFCGLQTRFSCFYAGAVCSGPPSPTPLPSGHHRYALRPCCRGPGGNRPPALQCV